MLASVTFVTVNANVPAAPVTVGNISLATEAGWAGQQDSRQRMKNALDQ